MEPEGGWQENVRVWVRKADTSRGLGQEPRRVPKKKKKVAPIPHDCNYTLHSCGSSGYCHSWVELSRSVFPKVHSLE